ncbi:hypothetical protein HMPREF1554_02145 [Porphyromonas gingivalis F0569]|nr:hypothetical protein HMPREF1554_02145 [Porphyromonas gingivalis F0569]
MAFCVLVYFLFSSVRIPRQSTGGIDLTQERVFHTISANLSVYLQKAWCRFCLFGSHIYTIVLCIKILNTNDIDNNPIQYIAKRPCNGLK